jgi:hypothetical protein
MMGYRERDRIGPRAIQSVLLDPCWTEITNSEYREEAHVLGGRLLLDRIRAALDLNQWPSAS